MVEPALERDLLVLLAGERRAHLRFCNCAWAPKRTLRSCSSRRLSVRRRKSRRSMIAIAAICACSLGLLACLSPAHQQVLRRVDIKQEAIVSVAASLGITVNNAIVRLHRARKKLRAKLLEYCGTSSVASCLDCSCEGDGAPIGVAREARI